MGLPFIVGYSFRSLFFMINNLMHEKLKTLKKKSLKYKAKKGYNLYLEHFEK